MDGRNMCLLIVASAAGLVAGCDHPLAPPPPPPPRTTIAVTGTVTELNGSPAVGAFISTTVPGNPTAVTLTDGAGRFALTPQSVLNGQVIALVVKLNGHVTTTRDIATHGVAVDATIAMPPLLVLPTGDTSVQGTLGPIDPPAYVGIPYDSDSLWNTQYFSFITPATDDLIVDLTFSSSGNAALVMYALSGKIQSTPSGTSQSIRLPKDSVGTLLVGQPFGAQPLTTATLFTLNARTATDTDTTPPTLAIESFAFGPPFGTGAGTAYEPSVAVRETTGQGHAEVTSVEFYESPTADRTIIGSGCIVDPIVPAGQRWDLSKVSAVCRDFDAGHALTNLTVSVRFLDWQGHANVVTATAHQ